MEWFWFCFFIFTGCFVALATMLFICYQQIKKYASMIEKIDEVSRIVKQVVDRIELQVDSVYDDVLLIEDAIVNEKEVEDGDNPSDYIQ